MCYAASTSSHAEEHIAHAFISSSSFPFRSVLKLFSFSSHFSLEVLYSVPSKFIRHLMRTLSSSVRQLPVSQFELHTEELEVLIEMVEEEPSQNC